eukprot:scaffold2088_cov399-Prasinococcus_capsulatus_cf.AAC.46
MFNLTSGQHATPQASLLPTHHPAGTTVTEVPRDGSRELGDPGQPEKGAQVDRLLAGGDELGLLGQSHDGVARQDVPRRKAAHVTREPLRGSVAAAGQERPTLCLGSRTSRAVLHARTTARPRDISPSPVAAIALDLRIQPQRAQPL